MRGLNRKLLDFVMKVGFDDLPAEVIHEAKRILLDSIGAAIAGRNTDKGRYGIALAKRFGTSAESAILGTSERSSCLGASFANGELINALDYDPFLYPTHAPPAIIPASLALGEIVGASG